MAGLLNREPFLKETAELFSDQKIISARAKITEWLNAAALGSSTEKCEALSKVQEIILNTQIELLEDFAENILSYSKDSAQEVRRAVVSFIEQICKAKIEFLPKVVNILAMLLRDSSPQVIKRVIQICGSVYKNALKWICTKMEISEEVEQAWNTISLIKAEIVDMIDHDNDGVRTNAVKFLEGIIILQTYADEDSMKRGSKDFSLEDVPITLKIARRRKLEVEALNIFDCLLQFHAAAHISSVNLIACTGTLCTVAKMRTSLMKPVVEALNNLLSNLPPTLTDSQVNSVKKNLKMQLLHLLRNRGSLEMQPTIISLLQDLGASQQEINKAIPQINKQEERRSKRHPESAVELNSSKRAKLDSLIALEPRQKEIDLVKLAQQKLKSDKANEKFLAEHLNSLDLVVQLVMVSIKNLPDAVPEDFMKNYKPITNMSIPQQISKIAVLLGEQMTENRIGPGSSAFAKEIPTRMEDVEMITPAESVIDAEESSIIPFVATPTEEFAKNVSEVRKEEAAKKLRENMEKTKGEQTLLHRMKQRIKTLKLQEITKPLSKSSKEQYMLNAISRILKAEWQCVKGGVSVKRRKILTVVAATFPDSIRDVIFKFITSDMKNRIELAFSWLYEEYCLLQGFTRHSYIKTEYKPDHAYNKLFNQLVLAISAKKETKEKIILLRRVYLESPLLSEESIGYLVTACELEDMSFHCLELIKDLIVRKPTRRNRFLGILLTYSVHENSTIREKALENLILLYKAHQIFTSKIEEFALVWLQYLENEEPAAKIFGPEYGRYEATQTWNEDLIKVCMTLALALLPYQEELIHQLSQVYTKAPSDIKRVILRAIETPVKKMGPNSAQILKLIEECPKGVETLVTRIVHTLTEKTKPTPELVVRVRQLYQTKVNDVRILIPILSGLTKQEILTALPKFLKLNPVVVKEVFNRLLRIGPEFSNQTMPVTPTEVLLALHTMDLAKCELKCIVKATSICLSEKDVYTQDTLAACLQQLVEVNPLPTLLMRTIIQSLTLYSRLAPFILNLLQRLILKQVWKHKVIWDGFLKCCQRLKPESFPIIMQLPLPQLQEALIQCPDLRKPLIEYAETANANQTEHISAQIMDVLTGNAQDVFVTDESCGYIRAENIKKEKDDFSELPFSTRGQPLPPGEE